MRKSAPFLLALALAAQGLAAHSAAAAAVTVKVTGLKTSVGKVIISLCTRKQFGATACSYTITTPARPGSVSVTFNTVAPGRYMAAAFQDLDGDAELKFRGMSPAEPAGVSGPKTLIPDFGKAAFDVGADPKTVSVALE